MKRRNDLKHRCDIQLLIFENICENIVNRVVHSIVQNAKSTRIWHSPLCILKKQFIIIAKHPRKPIRAPVYPITREKNQYNTIMSSSVRQNFHPDCEEAINRQINMELYASYTYMSMVR